MKVDYSRRRCEKLEASLRTHRMANPTIGKRPEVVHEVCECATREEDTVQHKRG
jgi:hypothetical protein